ncbi:hypothetical protein [Frankia nepalensis]|uniref:Uncharacterized protein n=1 Tax=Frankia nepalensis TaxID=1836974 RepID=A0A937RDR8_9ACTN|nr:hypothetical protein [Frankia nepalensis]MBL7628077.1 hypothetical protein [Frankia nepalensis]
MSKTEAKDLPLGTSAEHSRMHTVIRRVCWVLLIGLVIEGALVTPFTLIWLGWPTLSIQEICDGLTKVQYSDPEQTCEDSYPINSPPFGGEPVKGNPETSGDEWGVQPRPGYDKIGFRELVRIQQELDAQNSTAGK